jgi:hypothetical protein
MVKVYPDSEFDADFPDDMVEEDGEIVVYPGKNVADAISEILGRFGYRCGEPVYGGYKWISRLRFSDRDMGFIVHTFEPGHFYLFLEDRGAFRWLPSAKRKFIEYVRLVYRELGADPRFTNFQWFCPKDDQPHDHPKASPIEGD